MSVMGSCNKVDSSIQRILPSSNSITRQFLPFVRFHRILGRSPVGISYKGWGIVFHPFPYSALCYGLPVALFSCSFCVFAQLQRNGLGWRPINNDFWKDYRTPFNETDKVSTMASLVQTGLQFAYLVQILLEYLIAWVTCSAFMAWLNDWNSFQLMMSSVGTTRNLNFTQFRNWLAALFLFVPLATLTILDINYNVSEGSHVLFTTVSASFVAFSQACYLIDDVKCILMFKSLQVGTKQIREWFTCSIQRHADTGGFIPTSVIDRTGQIIEELRDHSVACGKLCTLNLLLSTFFSIFFCTIGMVGLMIWLEDGGNVMRQAMLCLLVATFALMRLLVKVYVAVEITNEEEKLTSHVRRLRHSVITREERAKLDELYQTLKEGSMEVSVNGFMSLNNGLILMVLGQVCTMFVVAMQFYK